MSQKVDAQHGTVHGTGFIKRKNGEIVPFELVTGQVTKEQAESIINHNTPTKERK